MKIFDIRRNKYGSDLGGTLVGWATRYGWEILSQDPDTVQKLEFFCVECGFHVVIVDDWMTYQRVVSRKDHPLVIFLSKNADKGGALHGYTRVVRPKDYNTLFCVLRTRQGLAKTYPLERTT